MRIVHNESTLVKLQRIWFNKVGIPDDQKPRNFREARALKRNFVKVQRLKINESYPQSGKFGIEFSKGWALKKKRKSKRFSQKQLDFVQYKFNIGQRSGLSLKAQKVADEMQTMKDAQCKAVFQPEERLAVSQIKSLFSRMCRKNKRNIQQGDSSSSEEEDYSPVGPSRDKMYHDLLVNIVNLLTSKTY